MATIKKAQVGVKVDKTSVAKSKAKGTIRNKPTYSGINSNATKKDSTEYKKGYDFGVESPKNSELYRGLSSNKAWNAGNEEGFSDKRPKKKLKFGGPIKKAQDGEKLNPKVAGPYSAKKYIKTKNPKSNFNIKGENYNLEIDTTGYAGGKKSFRGLETSTKPGKPRPIGVKANRDVVTDAINKGTNKKAKDGMWMQKAAASIKKRGTEGKCTPITKPGCTGKAKTLAKTFKKIAKKNKK